MTFKWMILGDGNIRIGLEVNPRPNLILAVVDDIAAAGGLNDPCELLTLFSTRPTLSHSLAPSGSSPTSLSCHWFMGCRWRSFIICLLDLTCPRGYYVVGKLSGYGGQGHRLSIAERYKHVDLHKSLFTTFFVMHAPPSVVLVCKHP